MSALTRSATDALRAYPTLLKVGFAEAIAYRAETVVWMLTNTMPLVNLALWHAAAVSAGGAIGGFSARDFDAYFLAALVVRQLASSWVLWEMAREIRMGTLSMRLLRPIHPLWAYSAENVSGLPLRAGLTIPVAAIGVWLGGVDRLAHEPSLWLMAIPAVLGAWLINFWANTLMGTLNFWLGQSLAVFQLWLGAYFVLSGYMFPLDFLSRRAPWLVDVIHYLPFYSMAGFPVEVLLGMRTPAEAMGALGIQWLWAALLGLAAISAWRAGVRRYNAVGA